jgi:hypothetical protein
VHGNFSTGNAKRPAIAAGRFCLYSLARIIHEDSHDGRERHRCHPERQQGDRSAQPLARLS